MSLSVRLQHRLPDLDLDVRFEAPPGVTVLFGRSGSGKTTIVNAVAGLLRPEAGRVAVEDWVLFDTDRGQWLPPHRRRLGYIFQEGRLFPHLTVRQNLAYGRWFAPKRAQREDPEKVIAMLGIGHLLDRRPAGLSGGEKQRVAIGRALLASPRLILADEPLAALDEARKAEILPYFERLRDEVSVPILYVTHSAAEVARLATSVVALQDGKAVRHGPASEVLADPSVAPAGVRAVGAVLEVQVAQHHADGLTELNANGARLFLPRIAHDVGAQLRIRIPAQEVILSNQKPEGLSALNVLSGSVASIRSGEGPGAIVSVTTPAGSVLARVTRRSVAALNLQVGSPCHAVIKTVALAPQDVGGRIGAGQ
ncbi:MULTISPECIES: molybdenum ABC transporter ATP-binding protein [unclassified Ruegeria]|uniref:molybdenum ABC transporter ATP-binding protein n=1 Tax=unclassified Ruegeria TaxID=2625375 RepID=UPI001487EACE|nr:MULTISPECIES: molybdenum ABC transporter ATP-binding protein [unclassified Ruegeria]NOD78922.1 molybdenum ABC transporter ATP-binding protein [Ruegeria sp. HKCCD4332]NOD89428.1 molybdenum ABC transporter ATP-binding protein [Ruegeria sp. HKCCD4318]NOE16484.1 molybdenum ABC transporter ATP-binding protein [Ruegeria sp. HKCCD4318-2]NOG07842.1 molybdenum ABC transporter ATP-binding protein [Ruegeria sp. HKCCD4315]